MNSTNGFEFREQPPSNFPCMSGQWCQRFMWKICRHMRGGVFHSIHFSLVRHRSSSRSIFWLRKAIRLRQSCNSHWNEKWSKGEKLTRMMIYARWQKFSLYVGCFNSSSWWLLPVLTTQTIDRTKKKERNESYWGEIERKKGAPKKENFFCFSVRSSLLFCIRKKTNWKHLWWYKLFALIASNIETKEEKLNKIIYWLLFRKFFFLHK